MQIFFLAFLCGIFADLFIYSTPSDFRLFLLLGLWILTVKFNHFKSKTTFIIALQVLTIMFIANVFFVQEVYLIERAASWLYFLLLVGILHQIFELKSSKNKAHLP